MILPPGAQVKVCLWLKRFAIFFKMNISCSQHLPTYCLPGWEAKVKSEWHNHKKRRRKEAVRGGFFVKKWNWEIVPWCKRMWQLGTQETPGPPVCHTELRPEDSIGDAATPALQKHTRAQHTQNLHAAQMMCECGGKMNAALTRLMAAF